MTSPYSIRIELKKVSLQIFDLLCTHDFFPLPLKVCHKILKTFSPHWSAAGIELTSARLLSPFFLAVHFKSKPVVKLQNLHNTIVRVRRDKWRCMAHEASFTNGQANMRGFVRAGLHFRQEGKFRALLKEVSRKVIVQYIIGNVLFCQFNLWNQFLRCSLKW